MNFVINLIFYFNSRRKCRWRSPSLMSLETLWYKRSTALGQSCPLSRNASSKRLLATLIPEGREPLTSGGSPSVWGLCLTNLQTTRLIISYVSRQTLHCIFLYMWPLRAKATVWVYLDESTTRYAIASWLHSYWRIFNIDTSKDSCWNQISFGILPLKIPQ